MDPVKIGAAIKTLRLKVGYTQHELADCLNVTDKAVSKWERGLSVPDISIVTKLSHLLNCDVDNLLEGNITYLEKSWQGLLIMGKNGGVFSGTQIYGKPLVELLLGYFLLAGIGDIYISAPERDRDYIERWIGDGSRCGVNIMFLPDGGMMPLSAGNTMVVYDNPFVYGPFLTRCFQRAMSRENGISVLTANNRAVEAQKSVQYNVEKRITGFGVDGCEQKYIPVLFFPKAFFQQVPACRDVSALKPLYAEPLDNGIVEYQISDADAVLDTALFFQIMKKRMGLDIYSIAEIAINRRFLDKDSHFYPTDS